ncbi:spore maturation protein CgeB [Paenarthrobacter nitroguajacolicus]|uniref:glycosyltransferase family protein n=1 Tax=Paenarthrobacter nitroguajacolicus TaxID=211146 RepID=UPI002862E124|nr:glycosyltransferase [Paenarthrobacter nitroguajacolicus]MDR6987955.1 spore maturation protein CgeB [Paenarthrobacter nitroguajacolicus]
MAFIGDARTAAWHLRRGGFRQLGEWLRRRRIESRNGSWNALSMPTAVDGRGPATFGPYRIPDRDPRRSDVTVGVILDDFSSAAFSFEWNLVHLLKDQWSTQLAERPIDFLFVESAWNGNGGSWQYQLMGASGPKPEFLKLMAWCREHSIPTVFWNKEDPPHYMDFLPTAGLFDMVFTSDSDRIPHYRQDLGHERIAVLPFAAQPAIHNPIRIGRSRHSRGVAFAGMYFAHKYPERRQQMDLLLNAARDAAGQSGPQLEIFSRQLGGDSNYQFPVPFNENVVGSLDYSRMLTAYRDYKVFLNVNSVVDSPSMCARRIFEITACGTPVVSTPSAAINQFFASDEVFVAESRDQGAHQIRMLARSPELNDRVVHRGQRRIWAENTYAHRAETIVASVLPDRSRAVDLPLVSALVPSMRPSQLEHVFATAGSQVDVDLELVLLTHGFEITQSQAQEWADEYGIRRFKLLSQPREVTLGKCLNLCVEAASGAVLTKMDDDDYYGPNYLADLLYALDYSKADVVGKHAHHMHFRSSRMTVLRMPHKEHQFSRFVMGPTITARREVFEAHPFEELNRGEDTAFLKAVSFAGGSIYAADRFNFCQMRQADGHTWNASDEELAASGEILFFGDPKEHITV